MTNKHALAAAAALALALTLVSRAEDKSSRPSADGPYKPDWESLQSHPMPEWLLDAKFGIYAHWGVYSVPAFETEWYAKRMYDKGGSVYRHHVEKYGDPSRFGYKDLVPLFKAEKYNPEEWAQFIEASGAKYAGLAVVHHDGFLLWDSSVSRWNARQMGPKRDLYGELVAALRKRGLKTIATEHHLRTFNWYLPGSDSFGVLKDPRKSAQLIQAGGWDLADPRYADLYWNELAGKRYADFLVEWQAKVREVIDKYQPDVLWFDGGDFRGRQSEKIVLDLLCYYHNRAAGWGKPVEVLNKLAGNNKFNFAENYGVLTFEEGRDRQAKVERAWIDDMKISDKGWCYVEGQQYKPANEIIHGLVDRAARGGGLLLNLSPKADGTIPDEQKNTLLEVGAWLKVNGEAIYGTRPWSVHAEGDEKKLKRGRQWTFGDCDASDIRFTRSKDGGDLYAIALGWPQADLTIKSLGASAGKVATVKVLGSDAKPDWKQDADALSIKPLKRWPCKHAVALKIEFAGASYPRRGETTKENTAQRQDPDIRLANRRDQRVTTYISGIDHPAVAAENVDVLADWYCDVLAYQKVFRDKKPVWILRAADGTLLEIMPRDGTPRPERTTWTPGWSHLALRVKDFDAAMRNLEEKGVRWTGPTSDAVGGGRVRNFFDPEGNMVQIVERPAELLRAP